MLALINFFGGGAAIFALGAVALAGMWTEYDGIVSVIGMVVLPFLVAIPSAIIAFLIGLPIRLVPPVQRWWLRHGGYTLIGGVAGFVLVVIGSVLMRTGAEAGPPEVGGWQVLLAGWIIFCLCATHTVWPRAWSSRGSSPFRHPDAASPPDVIGLRHLGRGSPGSDATGREHEEMRCAQPRRLRRGISRAAAPAPRARMPRPR